MRLEHLLLHIWLFYGFMNRFVFNGHTKNISSNVFSLDRWKRQVCTEFSCESGECISDSQVCDGKRQCKDRSDETTETCLERLLPSLAVHLEPSLISFINKCPPSQHNCGYSKCIDLTKRCDEIKDCLDGSDEDSALCLSLNSPLKPSDPSIDPSGAPLIPSIKPSETPPIQVISNCKLPEYPANGKYQIIGCNESSCRPGTVVSKTTVIKFDCDKGFKLSRDSVVWCDGLEWSSPFPSCQKVMCPRLQDPTRKMTCIYAYEEVKCSEKMMPSTVAKVSCDSYFTASAGLYSYLTTCKEDGEWSNNIHPCVPECGIGFGKVRPFVSNGFHVEVGEYPWHVAIYQRIDGDLMLTCGGSIIRPNIIISAAHCFWNEQTRQTNRIEEFKIAAGKIYRDWNNKNNTFQEAEISNITVHPHYNGFQANYAEDIAIVILKRKLAINEYVSPICLDTERKFLANIDSGAFTGIVAGWGYTQNQTLSKDLRGVVLPVWDKDTCFKSLPQVLLPHISHRDKFCAGTKTGTTVCQGDSGGGFAVRFANNSQYFLIGIVSVGVIPERDNCDLEAYAIFTNTSEHIRFIKQFISNF